jgi:hypothetical protein
MRHRWTAGRLPIFVTAAALMALLAPTARAGEAYYLLMFGSQQVPNNPNYSHSFATFVKATWLGDGPCPQNPVLEAHTISWLPCNMVVRLWALCPEEGRNFELHKTIRWCLCNDMRVSLWGAYQIDPELYCLAMRRIGVLESGQVRYLADDSFRNDERVTNCIHAISAVVDGSRLVAVSPGWGEPASYNILRRLEPWVVNMGCTHPWVGSALGLDQYPIIYRDFTNPRSGAIRGPLTRLLGGERDLVATYGPPVR